MNSRAILALCLLVAPAVLRAAEPRLDRNGDPLPEGAVARFGSARLLHGGVRHLEFSPDRKVLASSGSDGVRLWDLATGKVLPCAHVPEWGEAAFAFTPDGGHLVGDADGCRLVDPGTGKVRCSWGHGIHLPRSIIVAADGKTAAVVWEGGGVTVHDLTRTGKRNDWKLCDDTPDALSLSGDGALLAYAREKDRQAALLVWDARRGKLLQTIAPEALRKQRLYSLCLSRDGRRLAAAWGDKVRLWDTASGAEVMGFAGPEGVPVFLRFSADGAEMVGVSITKEVRRWSARTGQELACSSPPGGVSRPFWLSTLSPDGRAVAGVTPDGSALVLWDAASGQELVPVERGPAWRGVAFVKPGLATFTAGLQQETVAFWDVTDGRLRRKHTLAVPEDGWWRRALSPDGTLFAANNDKRGVLLFDVASGKEVRHFDVPRRGDEGAKFAFSPDGKTLVTTDFPRGLRLWDVATGKPLHRLEGDSSGVMAFSPDGRCVASAFVGQFYLTEVASGKARFKLPLPDSQERERSESAVERIRFARDGRSVAAISRCDIHVFSTARGITRLHLFLGGRTNLWSETGDLSPDGRWLAHADNMHRAVSVRDLNSPHALGEYQTLRGHAGDLNAVEFSPDGKYLVSCGSDGTALVWDARLLTGKPKRDPPRRPAPELGVLEKPGAETHWPGLADVDAGRAARAMAALVESPEVAVPLLKARLKPAETPTPEQVERLLADLDSDTFAVRAKAFQELSRLGELAAPALRRLLQGKPSAEVARQAKRLLSDLEGAVADPGRLWQLRAVEVLERIGTPAAREVLETLAKGAPEARLTQEAKASLQRLAER
jgi:WD40 repeat protein